MSIRLTVLEILAIAGGGKSSHRLAANPDAKTKLVMIKRIALKALSRMRAKRAA